MKIIILISIFIVNISLSAETVRLSDLTLKTFDKKKINTKELYKDGPILLSFWNLACEPCKKEMKFLNDYDIKYEEYGFNVISINMDTPRSLSKVKSYIKSKNYEFTLLSDPRSQLFRKNGGTIMPYTLIVDTTGMITSKHIGYNLGDEIKLEAEIVQILGLDSLNLNKENKID